jgi:formylglycine-generating enzyme required for sulfatase activity
MVKRIFVLGIFTTLAIIVSSFSSRQEEITNSIGMKLQLIPAGSFMMGAVQGDNDAEDNEKPQHRVEITKPFYIGVYEVTQAQYEAVIGDNPSTFKGSDRPVETVSWIEAVEFCRKLTEKEGGSYRLPTEAEWEYAARGGVEGEKYVWGDEKTPLVNGVKHANVADESIKNSEFYEWLKPVYDDSGYFAGYDDGYAETSPVGSYAPNNYGLYDMAGNILEWCSDWAIGDYYSISPLKDPTGPSSGESRIVRGGCWYNYLRDLRTSYRSTCRPDERLFSIGFRVVRDVK